MDKQEFLARLRQGLAGLPTEEIEERLSFCDEMIDDRMEEGLSEEQAVDAMGDVDELVVRIIADVPLTKLVKGKIRPNHRLGAWEILLLVLGSPVWVSLLIAAAAVAFSSALSALPRAASSTALSSGLKLSYSFSWTTRRSSAMPLASCSDIA